MRRLPCAETFPIRRQLRLMQVPPLEDEPQWSAGEAASDNALFDRHGHLVLAVDGVEVRWRVFVREHPDDDAEESADLWHARDVLPPRVTVAIDRSRGHAVRREHAFVQR